MAGQLVETGKVLVVDDSETNRILLRSILNKAGYQVDECENGKQCLEYCQNNKPTLILLDVMMPEMDGITALKHLREAHNVTSLPVIMVTTKTAPSELAEAFENGANDYITKPIDMKVLMARVKAQMHRKEIEQLLDRQSRELERLVEIQSAVDGVLTQAIAVHDLEGNIVYSNRMLAEYCASKVPKNVAEIIATICDGEMSAVLTQWTELIKKSPAAVINQEVYLTGRNFKYVQLLSRPLTTSHERYRVWLFKDQTQTRELEKKLNQQIKLESVSTFASGVAHNFNNIVGAMIGSLDLLERQTKENPKALRCVNIIRKCLETAQRFTKKMAVLAQNTVDDTVTNGDNLKEALESVCEVQESVSSDRITLVLDLPEQIPTVNLPAKHLYNVLTNVISNAVEAIENEGQVVAKVMPVNDEKMVRVVISDNGCGMSQETLQRMFEPFFTTKNLDNEHGISFQGNGLGLWNVYNLLKLAGGDVQVKSTLGQGTEVTMLIPLIDVPNS